ncbi:MAG TPA: BON domain-containing protein [Candidatus Manganitrophaceae bacterium]|nr:BON domain-containing protein [Candidatus Manganitrophaceae bacterium]
MKVQAARLAEKETSAAKERALVKSVIRNLKSNAVADWPASLRIGAESGVVHLSGHVSMQAEKQMIEEIVRLTAGVVSVDNRIEIVPCSGRKAIS